MQWILYPTQPAVEVVSRFRKQWGWYHVFRYNFSGRQTSLSSIPCELDWHPKYRASFWYFITWLTSWCYMVTGITPPAMSTRAGLRVWSRDEQSRTRSAELYCYPQTTIERYFFGFNEIKFYLPECLKKPDVLPTDRGRWRGSLEPSGHILFAVIRLRLMPLTWSTFDTAWTVDQIYRRADIDTM